MVVVVVEVVAVWVAELVFCLCRVVAGLPAVSDGIQRLAVVLNGIADALGPTVGVGVPAIFILNDSIRVIVN